MAAPHRRRNPAPAGTALGKLGARIRELRVQAGSSQAELGRPHATRAGVSAVELGKSSPSVKLLLHFAHALREKGLKVRLRDLIPPGI